MTMLFVVGAVLTMVRPGRTRWRLRAGTHGLYLALFALLYVGTAGFHDFTRLGQ